MTEIQNSKYDWVIEYWNLRFVCNLVLEVWDFITMLFYCFISLRHFLLSLE